MLRKNLLLGAVLATTSIFASANAYTLTVSGASQNSAVLLAEEVVIADGTGGNYAVTFDFDDNTLGNGPMYLDLTFTGAVLAANLDNTAFGCTTATSVSISEGGDDGDSMVSFRIEGAGDCDTGTFDVSFTLDGFTAGTPVTVNSNLTDGVNDSRAAIDGGVPEGGAVNLVSYFDAYSVTIEADPDKVADLDATPKFSDIISDGSGNSMVSIVFNAAISNGATPPVVSQNIFLDLDQMTPTNIQHFVDVIYTITGDFSFTAEDANGASKSFSTASGATLVVADDLRSATATLTPAQANNAAGSGENISYDGNSETPFNASDYSVVVSYSLEATGVTFSDQADVSGSMASILRGGTTLTFPWVSSSTQGASTGSANLIRVGNTSGAATGAVSARVLNSTEDDYTISATTTEVAASIPANGEVVLTSQSLEDALGNWGRGDIEIFVEETSNTITGNRLIVNSNRIVNVDAGKGDKYSD